MRLTMVRDGYKLYIAIGVLVSLVLKCVCLLVWGRMGAADTGLIVCSSLYYLSLAGLCVYSGKARKFWIALCAFFGLEVLMLLVSVVSSVPSGVRSIVFFASFVNTTSHYGIITLLKAVCQPFNDWIYLGVVAVIDAALMGVHFLCRHLFNRVKL